MRTKLSSLVTTRRTVCSAICAVVFATAAIDASAQVLPTQKRYLSKPLNVCDMGSFYIGGVPKVTQFVGGSTPGLDKQITIGQMYVQFMIPRNPKSWPIIAVHGGA